MTRASDAADAVLVFPPMWLDLHSAYPALPYLAGYLKSQGYSALSVDLNRDYLQTLLEDEQFLDARFHSAIERFEELDGADTLDARRVSEYLELLPLVSLTGTLGGAGVGKMVREHREVIRAAEAEGLFIASGAMNLDNLARLPGTSVDTLRLQLAIRPVLMAASTCVLRGSALQVKDQGDVVEAARELFAHERKDPAVEHYVAFVREHLLPGLANQQLIGISVTVPTQLLYALVLAREVRAVAPQACIVIGGNLITHLRKSIDALSWTSGLIDAYIHNEGEIPLVECINAVRDGRPLGGLPNVMVPGSGAQHGAVVQSPVDALPDFATLSVTNPPREYFSRCLYLRTSRGCYYARCKYCTHPLVFGANYRSVSVDRLVEIMRTLSLKHDTRCFFFTDEALAPNMAEKLSAALIDAGSPFQWGAYQRFEQAFVRLALLEPMYRAGCRLLVIGLESVNARVVELMDKGTTKEAAQTMLDTMKRLGMGAILYTLTGYPTETEAEARETYEFVKANLARNIESYCHLFWLNVHSPSFTEREQLGVRLRPDAKVSLVVTQFETDIGMNRRLAARLHQELAVGTFNAWKALFADDLRLVWSGSEGEYRMSPFVVTRRLSFSMKQSMAAMNTPRALLRQPAVTHYVEELGLGRRMEVSAEIAALLDCFRTPVTFAEAARAFCAAHGVDVEETLPELRRGLQMLVEAGFVITMAQHAGDGKAETATATHGDQRPVHAQLVDCLADSWRIESV